MSIPSPVHDRRLMYRSIVLVDSGRVKRVFQVVVNRRQSRRSSMVTTKRRRNGKSVIFPELIVMVPKWAHKC